MKINRKVQKIGVVSGAIIISMLIVGKVFDVPLLSGAVNTVLYPFEKGIQLVTSGGGNVLKYFKDIHLLIQENETLKAEVSTLRHDNTVLAQCKDENESLMMLLEMKKRFVDYEGTGANIIARNYDNWNRIYTIDKGSSNNISEQSVVLADGGLVGYVSENSFFSSKVVSIIDSRSAVSAEVVRTGDKGILKGDIELADEGLCILEINDDCEIMKGDQIITSYLSNIYPPGILIGTVERVDENNNELVSYAYIKPVVDFEHLKQVLVVENKDSEEEINK